MGRSRRPSANARGYDPEWQRERAKVIAAWKRESWPCALCGRPFTKWAGLHVDHIERLVEAPHRKLDWSNLRVAHQHCHNRLTRQEENDKVRGFSGATGEDGYPIDPAHPANRKGSRDG